MIQWFLRPGLSIATPAWRRVPTMILAIMTACTAPASAESVVLHAIRDNTLIQSATGNRSNGTGGLFSGRVGTNAGGTIRRAVVAFDLTSIPPGSTITSATLILNLIGSNTSAQTHTLHRLLASWGEGGSYSDGGQGSASQPNDATWIHRFYPGTFWSAAGGDFVATPSATSIVGEDLIHYAWSSSGMIADAQGWLDDPATNHGWLLKGNEAVVQTVKKFSSHEVEDLLSRPRLVIEFIPPSSCPCDINSDGKVGVPDLLAVINAWGPCPPKDCVSHCYCDIDQDCVVGVPDLLAVINAWGDCAK